MRPILLLMFAILVIPSRSVAQREPASASDMQAMDARLLTRIGPQARAWIRQEAAREWASQTISERTAEQAVSSKPWSALMVEASRVGPIDSNMLVYLVIRDAYGLALEDLKFTVARLKYINAQKASVVQSASGSTRDPANRQDNVRHALDSLEELNRLESLRRRIAMDRIQKINVIASDIARKVSSAESSITLNLR